MRTLVPTLMLLVAGVVLTPVPAAIAEPDETLGAPSVHISTDHLIEFSVMRGADVRVDVDDPAGEQYATYSYDLQVRRASMLAATPPPWQLVSTGSHTSTRSMHVRQGRILCVRARLRNAEAVSAWSDAECAVRPLGDERLRRRGPMSTHQDRHFVDGRATVLRTGARLTLSGIPAGSRFGPVVVDDWGRDDGDTPTWYLQGHGRQVGARGGYRGNLMWMTYLARSGGTAVVLCEGAPSVRIGGLVVMPRWLRRTA